ncbi:hypothetical protein [Mycobacterium intracellulare]|uniref:hypothetical protein n=1 Tax=Mycobacterium intracellulare TaxID=1767 RepID=UPI000C7B5A98|nr:hypothetical protein [Mycobacterium intracellulare]
MSKPTTDHEHYCAATQAFFDEIDRDGDDVIATHFPDSGDELPPPPSEPEWDPAGVGEPAEQFGERRPADDDELVDLDGPGPAGEADEQPGPVDTDTPAPSAERDAGENPSPGIDLANQPTSSKDEDNGGAKTTNAPRYNKKIAAGFAAITVVATVLVSAGLLAMRSDPHTNEQPQPAPPGGRVSVLAAPSSTTPAPDSQDSAIPYTATSVGCLPGSTAAQSVAGPDPNQAWVCVTGGNVGQFLVINLGRTMVVTSVCITPGWVGADASGADQYHQHRVLTRVQWSFNDVPPTAVPQETGSVHGEACKPLPSSGVLASRIIMLVQETGRAPADTAPTTTSTPGGGGLFGEVLGPPAAPADPTPTSSTPMLPGLPADTSHTDPADNTFAVSAIKIFGHSPLHQ